eukprot:gnl/TRDRNA2_/TRDRNA2_88623_c1_seq1.p2 gnl/TRDRNA2_/TRDRNA2_88623_c1~~gnl/TRDRNA2_/TRDRNA2_88623_c1_seq1.p2  ORF type:complete len:192 (+),score=33.70 gnl/TRDRNA2_/TRDRNA2_88623_c1_seq1:356-931(+)
MLPKLLQEKVIGGGTDGDGVPPSFNPMTQGTELQELFRAHPWDTTMRPKIEALIGHVQKEGAKKIGMVGFCWGGWVVCHTSADFPVISCGVIPHPSVTVEQSAFGGNSPALAAKVQCPILFLPSANDGTDYSEGGKIFDAVKARNKDTASQKFPTMMHGWTTRGDVSKDKVKKEVEAAIVLTTEYLDKHMA